MRHRAKEIIELLADDNRIRDERRKTRSSKSKYVGVSSDSLAFSRHSASGSGEYRTIFKTLFILFSILCAFDFYDSFLLPSILTLLSFIFFSCCFFFSCFVLWFAVFSLRLCSVPSLFFSCARTHHLWLNQCGGSAARSFLFSALQFSPLISHRHPSSNSLVVFVFRGGIRAVISFSPTPSRHSRLRL